MQFSLVAAFSLLASAEAAHLWSKPGVKLVKPKTAVATNYTWSVTGWSAGCARAGCYYGMSLFAPNLSYLAAQQVLTSTIRLQYQRPGLLRRSSSIQSLLLGLRRGRPI